MQDQTPTVSVIMPAHNSAAYVDQAIESVLGQSWCDLELIVVDDGSTDATPDIVRAWATRDPRVCLLMQQNHGISAARNAALRVSRGRMLALLDSDDLWERSFLAVQLRLFELCDHAGIVTANAFYRGGALDGQPMRPVAQAPRRLTLRDLLEHEDSVCIMSVFRREVYESIGGFDERLRCNEDYQFWIRAVHAGFGIVQSPEPLGHYRRRPDSVSADQGIMLDGIMQVLSETRGLCAGMPDERAIIDRQLRRFQRERLLLTAKLALLDGAFSDARSALSGAIRLGGGARLRAVAACCRIAPGPLRALYRMRVNSG